MPIESATYISQLNTSEPPGSDPKSILDNHVRMMKLVLQNQFPNLGAAAVVRTAAELNSVTDRALRAGDTYTGTHAFAGATAITVPTVSTSDSSTNAASTAMVQAAIAAVNAVSTVTYSSNSTTAFSVAAGQVITATNSSAVAVTFPASPSTAGTVCGVIFDNGKRTNTIDLGANGIKHNGTVITGVITCGARFPMVLRWGGDYWRFL